MAGEIWTIFEEQKAQKLLQLGLTYKEVGLQIKRTCGALLKKNKREWQIPVGIMDISKKLSRALARISSSLSIKRKGHWAGKTNPNYGAKIVKRGKENPLSIWKSQNPGYQDGEKNPMYGKILSPEEIAKKTARMVSLSHRRKGKTYKEFYGEEKSAEISKAMSLGNVNRMSKQKDKNTSIELKMKDILNSLGIIYEFQYPFKYFCVDFFIPSLNLVIQTDGCYWHGCPKHFLNLTERQKERIRLDHSCDSFLTNRGHKILRVWECEIDKIDIESQIKSFTKEESNVLLRN